MEHMCTLHEVRIVSGAGLTQNPAEIVLGLLWDLGTVTCPPAYIPLPLRECWKSRNFRH